MNIDRTPLAARRHILHPRLGRIERAWIISHREGRRFGPSNFQAHAHVLFSSPNVILSGEKIIQPAFAAIIALRILPDGKYLLTAIPVPVLHRLH